MKKSVRLPAFAKINLRLEIVGRRADAYHELRTVFQSISLHDSLTISLASRPGVVLDVGDTDLPTGRDNLVHRAIQAFRAETGFRGGVQAKLEKRIPVARGLGGGSSDAAAALVGMLRLTKIKLPLERLLRITAGLGADVPFFLFGGRALAVNRGDEIYPLEDMPRRRVVIVSPRDIGVSTKEAYQWVSSELTNRSKPHSIWGFCALCWSGQEQVANDFEGPVFRRHPRLGSIRDALLRRGAAEAALAGSGSAVFGLFRNPAQARRAARRFPDDSVFVEETVSRETYGRALGWRATG